MTPRTTLGGRTAGLERLVARLDLARAGEGGIVMLSGEAGVGKTRLISELARQASDALVLTGTAGSGISPPYGAVVGALRAHLRAEPGALAGSGPLAPHLAMILPE